MELFTSVYRHALNELSKGNVKEEYIEVLYELVNKDSPASPYEIELGEVQHGKCPGCNTHVNSSQKYCSQCGQSLYWVRGVKE